MIIKTFDPETLQEKETISRLTSVIWTARFYKVGSFEIGTTSNSFKVNDVIAYQYNGKIRSGIVMKITESDGTKTVSGYDLKGLYSFRYITNPVTYTGTPDTILKSLIGEFLNTADRTVPRLIISDTAIKGASTSLTTETGYLDIMIETFGTTNEIGTALEFDLKNITFKTLKGADKSAYIKFSRKNRTVENIEYTNDLFNTYNVGYSADEEGNETVIGAFSGILRRECYKDKNVAEYLSEKAPIETLRGEANEKYKYGIDYELGDYVTVATDTLETVKQITEIKEVHEKNRTSVIPVFGTEKENPLKKILKGA